MDFFTRSATTLLSEATAARVKNYVLLSIVGVDGIEDDGYLRGKHLQEQLVAASGSLFTIVRATQFHEFAEGIVDSLMVDGQVHAPDAMIQPVAAAEVAAVVARVATEAPRNGVLSFGGPQKMPFAELARTVLTHRGENVPVIVEKGVDWYTAMLKRCRQPAVRPPPSVLRSRLPKRRASRRSRSKR